MIITLAMAIPALLLQAAPSATDAADAPQSESQATQTSASAEAESAPSTKVADASIAVTDKSHPDYVRCRSERVIGSLAKRTKTCKTNREWEEVARVGNRGARDIVESQQVGMNGQ